MKLKLDTKTIAALSLDKSKTEDFAWDAELEGFGLRLRRNADGLRRTYVAQYRAAGRTRRVKLGTVEKLSPMQARQMAASSAADSTRSRGFASTGRRVPMTGLLVAHPSSIAHLHSALIARRQAAAVWAL